MLSIRRSQFGLQIPEALKGITMVSEIAREYAIHPVRVSPWNKEVQEWWPEISGRKRES